MIFRLLAALQNSTGEVVVDFHQPTSSEYPLRLALSCGVLGLSLLSFKQYRTLSAMKHCFLQFYLESRP
jgi:hypothetical protein